MKKIVALLLSVFVLTCSVSVFAADDFVSSPTGTQGPTLITGVISDPDCDAHIVVTPYSQRDTLPADTLAALEAAFTVITGEIDLTSLNDAFASHVASLSLNGDDLAVSDLFDVSYVGCTLHNSHGTYSITVSAANLDKFVGLLHNTNGAWDFVDNATVSEDNSTLSFTVSELSPFAIVVKTEDAGDDSSEEDSSEEESEIPDSSVSDESTVPDGPETPDTGDNAGYIWAIIAAVAALAVGVLVLKKKRA